MSPTPGNSLYLYRLLSEGIGVGRQTMLARVEEVLLEDDVMPSDLGCESVRELLESLDFVRVAVFKRGRVYATVLPQPEWDALLERLGTDDQSGKGEPAAPHKSWKRKRNAKALRPEKPRPRGRVTQVTPDEALVEAPAVEVPEEAPAVEVAETAAAETTAVDVVETESAVVEAPAEPEPTTKGTTPHDAEVLEDVVSSEPEAVGPEAESETTPEAEPEAGSEAVAQPTSGGINLTVTYVPADDDLTFDVPSERTESQPHAVHDDQPPISATQAPATQAPTPTTAPARKPLPLIPRSFAAEVWCTNDVLDSLYRILPFDVNPLTLLDEDWAVARSTESYQTSANGVSFDLRCLRGPEPEDAPVRAWLRRRAPSASGKRWQLVSLGGPLDDATVSFEGLPAVREGAWTELDGLPSGVHRPTSPLRLLTQFALIGPWDALLGELANLAEPEPWGDDLSDLREYLTVTFARLRREHKVVTSADGQACSFDTGLLTEGTQRIYACFDALETGARAQGRREGGAAWRFAGFSTDPHVEKTPEPASYLNAWEDLCLAAPYGVQLSKTMRRTYGDTLDCAIERSVCRARRNYRLATPAYDPQTDEIRLLLPLTVEQAGVADHAVVLARLGEEGYEARAVLSLEHARICARVVSSELPAWLMRQ
ncbi:MAG: DUF3825 domain-containing protein [Atopobiaceae bacterium]|nr:DUF3825 domain-containing protein [Atopobiaceae bacterium]